MINIESKCLIVKCLHGACSETESPLLAVDANQSFFKNILDFAQPPRFLPDYITELDW